MPADRIPADTSANRNSNNKVATNAPMRAPPMTMPKKAMVMDIKKILNSSSGWGMEGSVEFFALVGSGLGDTAAALGGAGLVVASLPAPLLFGGGWGFAPAESALEPG